MGQIALIGMAGGAASALLFASIASGSPLSIPLFYLSPLPVLIVALGWNHRAGLVAALVASAALALIFGGYFFLGFLLGVGLPSWWLSYLAILARPAGADGSGDLEWYPVGRIVLWAALISAAVVALVILTIATEEAALRATLRKTFEPLLTRGGRSPVGADSPAFVRMLVEYPERVLPQAASVLTTIVTVFSLWLAGRIVRTSQRLVRPWPDISAMTFPRGALALLAGALIGALILPGLSGIFASMLSGSLLTAYGLLGLAVLHAVTFGLNGRGFILAGVYGGIVVFGWPILILAIVAVADQLFNLRGRTAGPRLPPPRE
jgi:hypothetical protein